MNDYYVKSVYFAPQSKRPLVRLPAPTPQVSNTDTAIETPVVAAELPFVESCYVTPGGDYYTTIASSKPGNVETAPKSTVQFESDLISTATNEESLAAAEAEYEAALANLQAAKNKYESLRSQATVSTTTISAGPAPADTPTECVDSFYNFPDEPLVKPSSLGPSESVYYGIPNSLHYANSQPTGYDYGYTFQSSAPTAPFAVDSNVDTAIEVVENHVSTVIGATQAGGFSVAPADEIFSEYNFEDLRM